MDYGTREAWEPTVGVKLSREEARAEAKKWSERNGGTPTRVRKYVPALPDSEKLSELVPEEWMRR